MFNLKKFNKYEFGKSLVPKNIYKLKYKEEMEEVYQKLYFDNLNYFVFTNIFFVSALLNLIIYVLLYPRIYVLFNSYLTSGFAWQFVVIFGTWFLTNLLVYYALLLIYFMYHDSKFKRAELEIEKDLPEFIDNLVSNLKGGVSLEKALLKSVRIDQKALLREVTLINEKVMMGMNVNEALKQFRIRYDSPIISRTFFLIEEGLRGGGNLAAPLERISENLKKIYVLDEEIKGNSSGFAVVIRSITLVVAPLLFALAITLLTFIGNLFTLIAKSGSDFLSVSQLPAEFSLYLIVFSYSMIILITIFSSLITSQLKNEKTYEAIKYLPIYVAVAILLYWQFSDILLGFFGNIIA